MLTQHRRSSCCAGMAGSSNERQPIVHPHSTGSVGRTDTNPVKEDILDSFHSLVRKVPVESLADVDPAKIFIVQLADAPWLSMDYLQWSRHFRNLPGQGEIPVKAFVSELLRTGYRRRPCRGWRAGRAR